MNEAGYQKIIEALLSLIDAGVYIVDEEGVGIFYNEAMATLEQVHIDDVVGKEFPKAFPGVKLSESTLYQALKKLPEKLRVAVVLHYIEGYKVKEIAAILHSTQTAVKKRLARGREALKQYLSEDE